MVALFIVLFTWLQPAQSTAPDLDTVVRRATEYVTTYETELGNLIGVEDYGQIVKRKLRAQPGTPPNRSRHTSSDFMLIKVGPQWVGLRDVKLVDGLKVKSELPPLESTFGDSPTDNARRFTRLQEQSTRYDIGDVLRDNSLPTFALQALRKDQVARFAFEQSGSDKIHGISVWRVKFREVTGSALVKARHAEDLYATGTLWIEPETGRILRTEFRVQNQVDKPTIDSSIVVTYAPEKALNTLVPAEMVEHYETVNQTIDCRAEYSKFHAFAVDVKFDFGPQG